MWLTGVLSAAVVSCPVTHTGAAEGRDMAVRTPSRPEPPARVVARVDIVPEDSGVDASLAADLARRARLVDLDPEPLAPFFDALLEMRSSGKGVVRVLHYGDSHTAADILTAAMRRSLQQRFGDGGRGFVLLGRPWRSYLPKDVATSAHGHWRSERILIAADPATLDGRYGLGGVSTNGYEQGASASVRTMPAPGPGNRVSRFEVFFMEQPNGGSFQALVDGKRRAVVSTGRPRIGSGFFRMDVPEGEHEMEVRLRGDGPVRLFGAVLENDGPGVVYDAAGVNGAFFYTPLRWDADLLAEQVKERDPKLLVTLYGANEADSRTITRESYADDVRRVIARLRAGAPAAACLMLGPMDRSTTSLRGGTLSAERLNWIIEVQADVADEIGCAFLNTRALMGGPGSITRWAAQSPAWAQPDGVHLTSRGYTELGNALGKEILDAFDRYVAGLDDPEPENGNEAEPR
ncbi:MAG: GDSL-type esterase/lipase family protein [Deltaproteobacteria bacterium]|nr:GDSL-type esterase/lipase family protein [Deltaproteobacteria bacterium]